MKKTLILAFSLMTLTAQAVVTSPMSNDFDNTGAIVKKDDVSIRVKNGEASEIAAGSVVVYSVTADDGATIASSTTSGINPACMIKAACAAGALCYCQKYGYTNSLLFDARYGSAAAGELLYAATASYYVGSNDDMPTRAVPVAQILDAASATGSVEAVLLIK